MAGAFVGQLSFSGVWRVPCLESERVSGSLGSGSHLMVARAYSWPGIFWPGPSTGLPQTGVTIPYFKGKFNDVISHVYTPGKQTHPQIHEQVHIVEVISSWCCCFHFFLC